MTPLHLPLPPKQVRLGLALTALAVSGCLQVEQTILLNPDNSGKATIKATMTNPMAAMMQGLAEQGGKEATEELSQRMGTEMAKSFAASMVNESKGIDAWDQVKYATTKEGGFTFEGVAYFPDLNELSTAASANAEGPGAMPALFRSEKSADGTWIIQGLPDPSDTKQAPARGKPVPPEEVDAKIKELRENWAAMEAIAAQVMKDSKAVLRIQVAGTIRECSGWKQTSPQSVTLELNTGDILTHLGTIINDDTALRQALLEGRVTEDGFPEPNFTQLRRLLFNGADKAEIVITPGAPLFDYAAETAKAKAAMSGQLKELLGK